MPDLMIELFSEEIPAGMQARAAADLKRLMTDGLVEAGLTYAHAGAFHTPRRLACNVEGLAARSPDLKEERKGPRTDAPEKALEGFLRATGLTRDDLEPRDDKKGQVWFAVIDRPGRPAADIVAEVLEQVIRSFPWPKSMRWGAGTLRWVRPLHGILCLLSDEGGAAVVPLTIDEIAAGDTTRGHRFMAPDPFPVTSFEDYEAKLKRAKVLLRAEERADHIWTDAHNAAFALGLEVVEDRGLLAEVAGLVEWPVVLMGDISADFFGLPAEVLQTSMREHQKFFSVRNPGTGRIEKFVTVANIEAPDGGATILAGNARVLAARLSDAKFFWQNDLRIVEQGGMTAMAEPLQSVTFHAKLGSQAERVERITALAREVAPKVGAKPDLAAEAAAICKADLASEMVYEFPELQGTMGKYYARAAGHDDGVPEACEEHYKPLGPSDEVPSAPVSVAVALADKIDTLTSFWAIDEKPTGSKDPYALRRAALGVIRLVLHSGSRFPLREQFETRSATFANEFAGMHHELRRAADSEWTSRNELSEILPWLDGSPFHFVLKFDGLLDQWLTYFGDSSNVKIDGANTETWNLFDRRLKELGHPEPSAENTPQLWMAANWLATSLLAFFHDRLKVHLRDEGLRHDVIDAVLAMPGSDDLVLVVKRARALSNFLKTDDGENLLLGFRRANNILTQAEEADGVEYSFGADPKFAEDPTEKALFAALDAAEKTIAPAMAAEEFETAMAAMSALRAPIDAFFDTVQVNTDNQTIRRNRLNLLSRIRAICLSVADLTRIEG